GWIDADDLGVARVIQPLQDQLRDGSGTAAQIDDLAPTGADHLLDDPAIDLGEKRVPGERLEGKAFVAALLVSCHGPLPALRLVTRGRPAPRSAGAVDPIHRA